MKIQCGHMCKGLKVPGTELCSTSMVAVDSGSVNRVVVNTCY